ncbi:MAG: hypothetical protein HQL00_12720 [Nitrospirae bacterium]|nr:hypothetical protein [Nitrospirota bacterium]
MLVFFIASAIIFTIFIAGFFINLNTTVSTSSGYITVEAFHQIFYNTVNGRLFQLSINKDNMHIFENKNPHAYINQLAAPVTFTMNALALSYVFWQDINFFYAIFFIFNYIGLLLYTWKLMKFYAPAWYKQKFYIAAGVLMISSYMTIVHFGGNRGLIIGPFILASYYYLKTEKWLPYSIATALGILTSDDSAMFYFTFAAYCYIFENKKIGALTGLASFLYTGLVLFIIQPAARFNLQLEQINHVAFYRDVQNRIYNFLNFIYKFPTEIKEVLAFIPLIVCLFLIANRRDIKPLKILGLIVLAPLSHWFITYATNIGGHHLMHIMACIYLTCIYLIAKTDFGQLQLSGAIKKSAAALFALFIVSNLYLLMVADFPFKFQIRWYLQDKIPVSSYYKMLVGQDLYKTIESNREFINQINSIPKKHSLAFWANRTVSGFISNRSDIWPFPSLSLDADFLAIQRNANNAYFCTKDSANLSHANTSDEIRLLGAEEDCAVSAVFTEKLIHRLVDELKTHAVAYSSDNVIVLKRLSHAVIEIPSDSIGLNFLSNVPGVLDNYLKKLKNLF